MDSVLRGQVVAELTALLETWGKGRCLLVPANPGLDRVISGGHYLVRGVPLHETDFAQDPEHPATTSDVLDILGASGRWPVQVLRPGEALPARGILVGAATSRADLAAWAASLDDGTLPAGASEFFGAFLKAKGCQLAEKPAIESAKYATSLFVCGSTSSYSRTFCQTCEAHGIPVLRMPPGLFVLDSRSPKLVREWTEASLYALESHRRAVVAIDRPLCREPGMPQILSGHLSTVVEQVLRRHPVDCLYAEGGATAVALWRRLGWKRLRVRGELATGVVCMQIAGQTRPLVTMKPGSYAWPDQVLPFADPV